MPVVVHHPHVPFEREAVEHSIADRFHAMVDRYPARTAVEAEDGVLTYRELDRLANRIASALGADGGDAPSVGLLLSHGASMIAAILGALKAGLTYVPLDPGFPIARLRATLSSSGARVLVTDRRNQALGAEAGFDGGSLLNVDALPSHASDTRPAKAVDPDRIAYILFTSGSTGQPKGVCQSHRNVLSNVRNYSNGICISEQDRMTLLSSCAFAQSVSGIFGALLNGATLCPFDLRLHDYRSLSEWLHEKRITVYHSVPTVFRQLVAVLPETPSFPCLRLIKLGGEPVLKSDVERYRKHFAPDCILHVGLGATEINIICQYNMDKTTPCESVAPVGYPPDGVEILILDEEGHPCPAGEEGEIAIRSSHLAVGYWRQPEQTAAAFQQDPADPTRRIYRTGDRGRLAADGCLTHLGRGDAQVKIRGQRVELGEVEAALARCPELSASAVVAHTDASGETRLTAYVVPARPVSRSRLRQFLREQLPDAMVPSSFVELEALPLTATGKVNRRALPEPDRKQRAVDHPYVAPRDPLEKKLADLWSELLDVDPVGVHDPFLDLGGNSLVATRIVSRVNDQLGIDLPLRAVLETPTVAQMAVAITQHQAEAAGQDQASRLLEDLEGLSEEEVRRRLAGEGPG